MESLPKWLSDAYSKLLVKKESNNFSFEQATAILNQSKETVLNILSELNRKGAVIVRGSRIDERTKEYRLIPAKDFFFAQGIQASLPEKSSFKERINSMGEHLPYLVTGEHAVLLYTNWLFKKIREIKVKEEDLFKWFAYLKDSDTLVILDKVHSKKLEKHKEAIKLIPSLTDEDLKYMEEVEDIKVIGKEKLVRELIDVKTEDSTLNLLAIVVSKRKEIDWKKLIKLCEWGEPNTAVGRMGFLLEVLNREARKTVVPKGVIELFRKRTERFRGVLPAEYFTENYETKEKELDSGLISGERRKQLEKELAELTESYKKIGEKWGITPYLPRHIITKIIEDLV